MRAAYGDIINTILMPYQTVIHKAPLADLEKEIIYARLKGDLEERSAYCILHHPDPADPVQVQMLRKTLSFDINPLPAGFDPRQARLVVTDMDSTLVAIETIDEIGAMLGIKPQVAAITEAAMRGELDFPSALKQRVALLKGLSVAALQRVYDERLRLNPGGEKLLACLKQKGIPIALVSGGFSFFTEQLKEAWQLDYTLSNVLEIDNGRLTGRVLGAIVGADAKAEFLLSLCRKLAIEPSQAVAVGDGANDLKMLKEAGLSIAYHAKPKVQEAAHAVLNHTDLEGICHLLRL